MPSSLPSTPLSPPSPEVISKARPWFILSGLLYLLSGLAAMIFPQIASIAIVQVIALLLIITGVISCCLAIFSKVDNQRMIHGFFALFRIIVGVLMLKEVFASLAIFTLILAILFLIEGLLGICVGMQFREHKQWLWILLNGLIALALGIIILARYPLTASWIIGLLYGINAIFFGITLLLIGCGGIKLADAPTEGPAI